jgi:hypothetical protein
LFVLIVYSADYYKQIILFLMELQYVDMKKLHYVRPLNGASLEGEMSIAVENLPLPRRGHNQKKTVATQ